MKAAEVNERARSLELDVAKQRERAATAERELLALQQRVAPRRLGESQRLFLLDSLKRATAKGVVGVSCVMGDGEGFAFATQIDEVLTAAGWQTTGVSQGVYGPGGNPIGFGLLVHSKASAPPYTAELQRAFAAGGFSLAVIENASQPEGTLQVLIGNKPQ